MDSLDFIQKAWVFEVIGLLVYCMFGAYFMPMERWVAFIQLVPTLGLLIAGQGTAAAAGPEIKRLIESRKAINDSPSAGLVG